MTNILIRTDYAGGNGKLVASDAPAVVRVEQEIRDSINWWFYWNFCARCEGEREVVFAFTNGEVLGPWGPAYSVDGINWTWLGEDSLLDRQSFVYRFTADRPEVFFAFGLPYQKSHFESFYDKYRNHPFMQREALCQSEQGREVPLMTIGNPGAGRNLFLSARHHACESAASYVLEGLLIQWLEDGTEAPELLDTFCLYVVPFVDMDGVENGDQGKGRAPHDHNRDYTDQPIYAATRAIIKRVTEIRLEIGIDFHCPYKWGERNDRVFIVKPGGEADREAERFGGLLDDLTRQTEGEGGGRLAYDRKYDIEKGEDWNLPSPSCVSFLIRENVPTAFSLEIPYFGLAHSRCTADSLRTFGRRTAGALQRFLEI